MINAAWVVQPPVWANKFDDDDNNTDYGRPYVVMGRPLCFTPVITSAKEGYVFVVVCLSVCLLATLRKNFRSAWHEICREGWQWADKKWLNFGGDPDHSLDPGTVFLIRHHWEIQKVVSSDWAARRCSAGHVLIGFAIATMTSLRHRQTSDSHNRRALAEVCTVRVLLVDYYFAHGSGCEVLWWVCLSVCLSVCLRWYLRNHTRDLYQIFVHVVYVRGSVLLRHVDDRPHRLSAGRGDGSAQRGRRVIYDCLIYFFAL